MRTRIMIPAIWICLLLPLLMSCDEELADEASAGTGCKSEVRFELEGIGGYTKSALDADDRHVGELSVFAYTDGYLADSKHFRTFSDMSMELFPDKVYDFYAVANAGDAEPPVLEEDMTSFVCSVTSVGDMSEGLPMSWSLEGFSPSGGRPVVISLSRLVAKVVLSVSCDVDDLSVSSVRIRQSPLSVRPFAEGGSRAVAGMVADGDHASEDDISLLNSGGSVFLYVLENMQGVLLPENGDPMLKVPDSLGEVSGLCTFLEVTCTFDEGADKEGTVVYRMYLGEDNVSDFNVGRNRVLNVMLVLTSDGFAVKDSWKVVPEYIQHVTSLDLDEDELRVRIGREAVLKATVFPSDATDDGVVWESDDESVAYVDGYGNVIGLAEGTCVVRARSADRPDIFSECTVYVENRVEELRFPVPEISAVLGSDGVSEYSPFNVEALYSDGSVRDVTNICGYFSDSASAYVETPGVVVHAEEGVASVFAECDGVTASFKVVTEAFALAGLELNVPHLTVPLGDTFVLKFRMIYNDGTVSSWIPYGFAGLGNASGEGWLSDDYGVAEVNTYGVVRPVSVGTADISITVTDTRTLRSFRKSLTVRVTEAYVVGVYVSASPMFCGGNYSLGLTGILSDGTETALKADSWSVSTPYVTFTEGSAGLQITDESMLQEGADYEFTAVYEGFSASASMKYGKWVLEAGVGKTLMPGGETYVYRMSLVLCDHSKVYVPFECRYSINRYDWSSVLSDSDGVPLSYRYPYVEGVTLSSYYDWRGVLQKWEARNH